VRRAPAAAVRRLALQGRRPAGEGGRTENAARRQQWRRRPLAAWRAWSLVSWEGGDAVLRFEEAQPRWPRPSAPLKLATSVAPTCKLLDVPRGLREDITW
jgi:hypothetical protein